ncbi:CLUMA_CG014439, isoform A [Clunio marinus]|uniref:CLUMA_CG014439, isoform A n=1 Tax=Clunio marinus TaxID=568069 RepID=A0A1J1IMW5_9DIPT|nr:CLUMA_CG014439, isoform A [Clunio marinus]
MQSVETIDCNFTFIESKSNSSVYSDAQIHLITPQVGSNNIFHCHQYFENDFQFVFVNKSSPLNLVNRLNSHESHELQEQTCIATKRFITPKALNSIYNVLTPVLNDASFVQKIQITECRTLREPCHAQVAVSSNYRHICWQEYLIIKLKAVRFGGTIYEEDFYYPSYCSCRLIRKA